MDCICLTFLYVWIYACIVSCDRGEMFMVLGSSILAWSILTMLLKDHMLLTRFVTLPARAIFIKYILLFLIVLWLLAIMVILGFSFEVEWTVFYYTISNYMRFVLDSPHFREASKDLKLGNWYWWVLVLRGMNLAYSDISMGFCKNREK